MKLIKILIAFVALASLQIAAAQWLNVPPPAVARNLMVVGGGVAGGASWSCTDANVLCDSFDTTAGDGFDDATWTTGTAGTSTVNPNYAHTGAFYCDENSAESLKLVNDGTNTCYACNDFGASKNAVYGVFYFKIDWLIADQTYFLVLADSSCIDWNLDTRIIYESASQFELYFIAYGQSAVTTTKNYQVDVWHKVEFQWIKNQATNGVRIWVDGTEEYTSTAPDYAIRYINFRLTASTNAFQVDNIKVSDTSMPSCE